MMQFLVNGEPFELEAGATLSKLVENLALEGKRYAIEVNEEIVARSEHSTFRLSERDRVEIVQAIGGG